MDGGTSRTGLRGRRLLVCALWSSACGARAAAPEQPTCSVRVEITGDVRHPGWVCLEDPPTLRQAIERVGGRTESTSNILVFSNPPVAGIRLAGLDWGTSCDYLLKPGDRIAITGPDPAVSSVCRADWVVLLESFNLELRRKTAPTTQLRFRAHACSAHHGKVTLSLEGPGASGETQIETTLSCGGTYDSPTLQAGSYRLELVVEGERSETTVPLRAHEATEITLVPPAL